MHLKNYISMAVQNPSDGDVVNIIVYVKGRLTIVNNFVYIQTEPNPYFQELKTYQCGISGMAIAKNTDVFYYYYTGSNIRNR